MKLSANDRFEIVAALYYRRYGQLAPGKSEPPEIGINSNSDENRNQYAAWLVGHGWNDAIVRIAELEAEKCRREYED